MKNNNVAFKFSDKWSEKTNEKKIVAIKCNGKGNKKKNVKKKL